VDLRKSSNLKITKASRLPSTIANSKNKIFYSFNIIIVTSFFYN